MRQEGIRRHIQPEKLDFCWTWLRTDLQKYASCSSGEYFFINMQFWCIFEPRGAEKRKNARHSSEKQFFEGSRLPSRPPTPLPPTLTRGAGLSLLRFQTSFETEIFGFEAQRRSSTRACGHKGHGPISPLSGCGPWPWYGTPLWKSSESLTFWDTLPSKPCQANF